MIITRESILTGMLRTRDINCTREQYDAWQYEEMLIQNAMPQLTPDDREFLMTGASAKEWEDASKKWQEENDKE